MRPKVGHRLTGGQEADQPSKGHSGFEALHKPCRSVANGSLTGFDVESEAGRDEAHHQC